MGRSLVIAGLLLVSAALPHVHAQQSRILFMREGQVYAVTPDREEAAGPLELARSADFLSASPGGRFLACTTSPPTGLHIYQTLPGDKLVEVEHVSPALADIAWLGWSPDGGYLAVGAWYQRPYVWPGRELPKPKPNPDDRLLGIAELPPPRWVLHVFAWHDGGQAVGLGPLVVPPMRSRLDGGMCAWTPDSNTVAWAPGIRGDVICLTELASGRTSDSRCADAPELGGVSELAWSHDGEWLAYTTDTGKLVVRAGGSASGDLRVVRDDAYHMAPRWSPNGPQLAFARSWEPDEYPEDDYGDRPMAVCVLDLDSGQVVDLTEEELRVEAGSIAWSPDGALIAFDGYTQAAYLEEYRVTGGPVLSVHEPDTNLYVADPAAGDARLVQQAAHGSFCRRYDRDMPIAWLASSPEAGE